MYNDIEPLTEETMKTRQILLSTLAVLLIAATAFAGDYKTPDQSDIVDTAVAAGSFNTLAAALEAAGLVDALKGDGPFTVFAPTDEAFAKLPAGTVDNLLKPENKEQLAAILTYHVVPGAVTASQVVGIPEAATLQGSNLQFTADSSGVTVNGANVIKADVEASNGVIHVIDGVLLPQ